MTNAPTTNLPLNLPQGINLLQLVSEAQLMGLTELAEYLSSTVPQLPLFRESATAPKGKIAQPFHYTLR